MMLLAGSSVDDSQRIPIFSSVGGRESVTLEQDSDSVIAQIKYEDVASVLRKCDRSLATSSSSQTGNNTVNSHSAAYSSNSRGGHSGGQSRSGSSRGQQRYSRPRMSPQELRNFKLKCFCKSCGKLGHWASDHNNDGTVKDNLPSIEPASGATASFPVKNPSQHDASGAVANQRQEIPKNGNNVMSFCARLGAGSATAEDTEPTVGPLVDDGAPYSAIGVIELCLLTGIQCKSTQSPLPLDPKPDHLAEYDWWQYGKGSHSSDRRRILGSANITAISDSGRNILIRHLVVTGSSQWVIGRNVTHPSDIMHYGGSRILFPPVDGFRDSLSMPEGEMHSHVDIARFPAFCCPRQSASLACYSIDANSSSSCETRPWSVTKRVIDKVHVHTCGHASYADMRTLLQRNGFWTDDAQRYLTDIIQRCEHCGATSVPPPSRKVAFGVMNRSFNDVVMVDHFYLEQLRVFHAMDSYSRFSAAYVVPDAMLESAAIAFESVWVAQFWPPDAVQGDQAFTGETFQQYLKRHGIHIRPVPSRRHHKNTLEPKHGIIRSIFLRLQSASPDCSAALLALQAVSISNDLYGSDTLSAFELVKGFKKPVAAGPELNPVPEDLITARDEIIAKRKLTLILRSHVTAALVVDPGDMVQVYVRTGKEKRGKWLYPRTALSVDRTAGTVTVAGSNGKHIVAAIEDTRLAVVDSDLASAVVESLDQLDGNLSELTEDLAHVQDDEQHENENFYSPDAEHTSDDFPTTPSVGDRLEVFWPIDNQFYPGMVQCVEDNVHVISYDDGDKEELTLSNETWRALPALNSIVSGKRLESNEQTTLALMLDTFGNKSFLRHHAQGFEQAVLARSYSDQKVEFCKRVRRVPIPDIPARANVIRSHVIYKVKTNDDSSLSLKARIAPHGNEDSQKVDLRTECCMCPPSGIWIVLSVSSMLRWFITKADVKSAFLQTEEAQRDVYVVPPRESNDRSHYWLLLTAAYGLVNANAKWQDQSDSLLHDLGLTQLAMIPQLFYQIKDNKLTLLVAKIVDDLLVTDLPEVTRAFLQKFNMRYKLGTVAHGPGRLRFYGMNIVQEDDFSSYIDADDKLESLEPFPLTRLRRREIDSSLTTVEKASFMSLNSSLGWLGLAASPFCAFYASYLQQKLPNATVSALVTQANGLKVLKNLGTRISFPRPTSGCKQVSVVVFADAGRQFDDGQPSYIAGNLVGPLVFGSVFYVLSWMSHKSKRPTKSIWAAEILAASEAIDEGKTLKRALSKLLKIYVPLIVSVDSKDLYKSLSTRRNSIDKSILADVNVIRFEYEVGNVDVICWLPESANPADPGTKTDSPINQALQLMMYSGTISHDLSRHETRRFDRSLG